METRVLSNTGSGSLGGVRMKGAPSSQWRAREVRTEPRAARYRGGSVPSVTAQLRYVPASSQARKQQWSTTGGPLRLWFSSSSSSPSPTPARHRGRLGALAEGGRLGPDEDPEEEDEAEAELLRALNLDSGIPESSTEFLAKVSSAAFDMRRRLGHTLLAGEFDVVEANPWRREVGKAVYVLAKEDDQLYTMRTRRPRKEVEHELDLLFSGGRRRDTISSSRGSNRSLTSSGTGGGGGSSSSSSSSRRPSGSSSVARSRGFWMHVEDVCEGVLVFEDETEAAQYCRVLDDTQPGQECLGVARFPATELFKVCEKSKALAVVFKKGSQPPSPDYLRHTLKARKHSLEDSDF